MVIKHCSFDHKGGWYHYRIHQSKCKLLESNGYKQLKGYLDRLFEDCPSHPFFLGPRSSALKFDIKGLDLRVVQGHEVSGLARFGLEVNKERFNTNHSKVQLFMLENDDKTVAVEVPIWLHSDEIENYSTIFGTEEPLTGHIDVLRIEKDKIWVWDYKPNAHRERYASTQVYFYALMLAKRTNLGLNKFRCGYFDQNRAYIFNPDGCLIHKNKGLRAFLEKVYKFK